MTPADTTVTVEDERSMCGAGTNTVEFALAVDLRGGVLADAFGMEAHAPATTKMLLLASTRAANASHVDSLSGLIVYADVTMETVLPPTSPRLKRRVH